MSYVMAEDQGRGQFWECILEVGAECLSWYDWANSQLWPGGVSVKLFLKKKSVVMAGLTNTYSRYVTSFEEYMMQRYKGASTLYSQCLHSGVRDSHRSLDNLSKQAHNHRIY